jgi:hypothetical protein
MCFVDTLHGHLWTLFPFSVSGATAFLQRGNRSLCWAGRKQEIGEFSAYSHAYLTENGMLLFN